MALCTAMRLAAVQRCPVVPNPPQIAPSTARSRLASSITMMMFLPPISRLQCLNSGAHASPMSRPTTREPLKLITGTSRCAAHGAAGFGEDFAHFAGHVVGELFLVLEQQLRGAEENFGALGRRHQAPLLISELGGIHSQIDVLGVGGDEHAD